jgi:hypothetical protein
VPVVGVPGSDGILQSPDCDGGYRAIVPPGSHWRNETTPRVMLRVAGYRPFLRGPDLPCPWLVCIADQDDLTPPEIARDLAQRGGAEVCGYALGHFDIYRGAGFEQIVADQSAFLVRNLVETEVPAAA